MPVHGHSRRRRYSAWRSRQVGGSGLSSISAPFTGLLPRPRNGGRNPVNGVDPMAPTEESAHREPGASAGPSTGCAGKGRERRSRPALLQVQLQKPLQQLVVADARLPAVGGKDRLVELAVGKVQPRRTLVVEVGERPLFQALGAIRVFGDQPRRACADRAARRGRGNAAGRRCVP